MKKLLIVASLLAGLVAAPAMAADWTQRCTLTRSDAPLNVYKQPSMTANYMTIRNPGPHFFLVVAQSGPWIQLAIADNAFDDHPLGQPGTVLGWVKTSKMKEGPHRYC